MTTDPRSRPIGYQWLVENFGLRVLPLHVRSYLLSHGSRRTREIAGQRTEYYPTRSDPGPAVCDQVEFALKHEGLNLEVLSKVFAAADERDIASLVRRKPTGIYARRLWFLYEWLTGRTLDCPDLNTGTYVSALEPSEYFAANGERSRRHRVINNLPGTPDFCPLTRRTPILLAAIDRHLDQDCKRLLREYDQAVIARAVDYLYTKETKSSYAIENETPSLSRSERFVALLHQASRGRFDAKETLIELQNAIVDPRFAASDYRAEQSYVGESTLRGEIVHYVCPRPQDVQKLMDGLLETWERMRTANVHPVVVAASIAFGLVFIHPFEDGNGRMHRFLLHNILATSHFTPDGLIFPISASMLRQRRQYDAVLELISKPLNSLLEYQLDDDGRMKVIGETIDHYRFLDLTAITEQLFAFVEDTIRTDLADELTTLTQLDQARLSIQEIADIPDRLIYLFIKLCRQNRGRISKQKRTDHFGQLTDNEIQRMEETVREAFGISRPSP